jgi:hypothetical protein
MFNRLVSGAGWPPNRHTMMAARMFEYTSDELTARFKPSGVTDFNGLLRLPTIFIPETDNRQNATNTARLGTIFRATVNGCDVELEYSYDPDIAAVPNEYLGIHANELGIADWECNRTSGPAAAQYTSPQPTGGVSVHRGREHQAEPCTYIPRT